MTTKTIQEKFDESTKKGGFKKKTKKGLMYISTPLEIEKIIKKIPEGKLTTTKIIAEKLTKKHKVDFTCPLTTGIFTSLAALKAEEERLAGKPHAPYWRVIKPDGRIYEAYFRKILPQKKLLKKEGFKLEKDNPKKMERVVGWEERVV